LGDSKVLPSEEPATGIRGRNEELERRTVQSYQKAYEEKSSIADYYYVMWWFISRTPFD
jgi:hypothetical protein